MQGLILMGAVASFVAWVYYRRKPPPPPTEIERRRRSALTANGKLGHGNIIDIREPLLFYSYDVRGVGYTATQEISAFPHLLTAETAWLIGPAYVRYDPKNPADSIVISENWSGLRIPHPAIKP